MSLQELSATGRGTLEAALAAAALPVADLARPGRRFFQWQDPAGAGFGGIEGSGQDLLLRSVVVTRRDRGAGVGTRLVEALVDQARRRGARRLWLLTTGAEAFFLRCGFHRVERDAAPASIQAGEEFRDLCPASAVLMMRALDTRS